MSTPTHGPQTVPYGSLAEALQDPCFFLVDFDFEDRGVVFSRMRPEWLEEKLCITASDLPYDSLVYMPLGAVLNALPPDPVAPSINYVFHMPFCGSSFLTRHLENDSVWLVRDPACLDAVFRKRPGREYPSFIYELRHATLTLLNRRVGSRSTVVRTAGYYPRMVELLVRSPTFRSGLLLYSSPEHYLLQVLKSVERRRDVRLLMSCERDFVRMKTGTTLDLLPDASVAVLFWIHFVETIIATTKRSLRTLNCEKLFAEPEDAFASVSAVFDIRGLPSSPDQHQRLQTTHAKTGEYFSPAQRLMGLERARAAHESELASVAELLRANDATALQAELESIGCQ